LLFSEVLICLLQTDYDTLFQIGLLHFGIISCHSFQISLEMLQIIMGFLIDLVKFNIFLLQVLSFPNNLFYFYQFIGHVLVLVLDLIHLSFDYNQLFFMVLKICCIVFSFKLQVCKRLWVSDKFSLTCSNSTLRFENSFNVLD
jgi:hypothetical protein